MNKQLQKKDLSIRELSKILFNTLKDENKLAIKMIVRNYNNNKTKGKKWNSSIHGYRQHNQMKK